jgi:hypothetical protein
MNLHEKIRNDPERFDALERAGFKLDRYGDLMYCMYERFGGHYMDVGASGKIARGQVSGPPALLEKRLPSTGSISFAPDCSYEVRT